MAVPLSPDSWLYPWFVVDVQGPSGAPEAVQLVTLRAGGRHLIPAGLYGPLVNAEECATAYCQRCGAPAPFYNAIQDSVFCAACAAGACGADGRHSLFCSKCGAPGDYEHGPVGICVDPARPDCLLGVLHADCAQRLARLRRRKMRRLIAAAHAADPAAYSEALEEWRRAAAVA